MNFDTFNNLEPNTTWKGQWLGYICLGMLVFFTWIPNSYYLMVSFPWIIVWQVGFLCLGIWAIWMLRQFKRPFKSLGYGLDWIVGFGVITLILSAIFAEFSQVSLNYISIFFSYGLLLYILRNWIGGSFLSIENLWTRLVLSGIVTGIIALGYTFQELLTQGNGISNHLPQGHRNFVAGYLLLILPLVTTLALTKKGWQKISLFLASLMLFADLYATQSRGGMLALLSVSIIMLFIFIITSKQKIKLSTLVSIFIAFSLLTIFILNSHRVQQIIKISTSSNYLPSIELKIDGESQDRLFLAQAAFNIFKNRPLFGVGAGNMSRVYNLYRPIEVGTGMEHVQQLHNTPLHLLGELGIFGLSLYCSILFILFRLWSKLYRHLNDRDSRYLLYGLGISFLAYTISSLTDYQLENISISSTLVSIIALLVSLTDRNQIEIANNLNLIYRRWISLIIVIVVVMQITIWFPISAGMYWSKYAHNDLIKGKVSQSYENLTKASKLVPYDPTYHLLAGLTLLNSRSNIKDLSLISKIKYLELSQFIAAWQKSPYDIWFNHNLGMLYRQSDPQQAEFYFSRTVQLLPRNEAYYAYYLLGSIYLKQGQIEKAISAFSLQGLINPEFLTSKIWLNEPLSNLHLTIVKKTILLLESLLQELPEPNSYYNEIYEKSSILKWWYQLPLEDLQLEKLRPIVKAILIAEQSPQQAITLVNQKLKQNSSDYSFLLFRAWLQPEQYLQPYLKSQGIITQKQQLLEQSINSKLPLRDWFNTIEHRVDRYHRTVPVLAYRNQYIAQGDTIVIPQEITINLIPQELQLFQHWNRKFVPLDKLIDRVKTEQLNLIHPTKNKYKLAPEIQ
jgi:O-antigen ligase